MSVIGPVKREMPRARFHDLSTHPGIEVTPGMRWLCAISHVEQYAGPELGYIGAIPVTHGEGFGDNPEEALADALRSAVAKGSLRTYGEAPLLKPLPADAEDETHDSADL